MSLAPKHIMSWHFQAWDDDDGGRGGDEDGGWGGEDEDRGWRGGGDDDDDWVCAGMVVLPCIQSFSGGCQQQEVHHQFMLKVTQG